MHAHATSSAWSESCCERLYVFWRKRALMRRLDADASYEMLHEDCLARLRPRSWGETAHTAYNLSRGPQNISPK